MHRLNNKRILLGITGGIAAYKTAEMVRHLRKAGAEVHVVMTPAACEFITPLTLQALSGNPVHTSMLDPKAEAGMGHIELAKWADAVLIAPASADFIARMAAGMGNDLLSTLCLVTQAPVYLAPAMNQGMWLDVATQKNCETLVGRGVKMFGPDNGYQACGDVGPGRMLDPDVILQNLAEQFETGLLAGKKVVITAGPTREAIDPVRYISNHSSGKMGFALAAAAADAGASVTVIAGPVNLETPDRVTRIDVADARSMHAAAMEHTANSDMFISCAAVADYRPETIAESKIKKDPGAPDQTMTIKLVRNPDIVASVAAKEDRPFVVGFAAETNNVVEYATSKLQRKKLDLVIANDVSDKSIGFNSEENAVTLIGPDFEEPLAKSSKQLLASQLIELIARYYKEMK
ncbi:bifunctional phosphopantothenoylcysteine decarboxylase/phosphopantothenate--cysteine ligase CoaBC [Sansalvadorimonas verongulae]|uniref:bifunctional phosphopantothenoylcysteine decarboxylase/phosphopantothenate--cysteine ligase CoaBC n=1 Tax=Sansalvadorimonas verongulae TaxID=2172824 RepID=UPI0012BC4CA1|nr:bifunctional phosphopantothenoylcysteine decarboxylase/phosphopantothenate--cysteine ligase CoaBC [Sansalvadorimonas verongulae]MTI13718.1 bifunctional phosphopantothenoylcysteine decarboxylase/phosphopantothenate--cysteine ligase CoaBC [Sansalvadorimonas verongulae]